MKKQIISILLAGITLTSMMASCGNGGSSSSEITITVWEDESNHEMLKTKTDEFIAMYKKEYEFAPSINVKFVSQSEKSAVEKLTTVASTGNGPDILAVTHDTIPNAVKAGLIDTVYYEDELKNRMTEQAIQAATYDSKLYGYPITAESMTLMYDKRQLTSEQVKSFSSIKAAGKKIALDIESDGAYYTFGFNTDSVLFGKDGTDKNSLNIGTSQTVANWTYFLNNDYDAVLSMTPETSISLFATGQIVGVISSPFLYSSVVDAIGEENVGLAVLPSINGVAQRPLSGYKCYVVNKYSTQPAIAHQLANYLTSDDSQAWRLYEKSYLPVTKTYTEDMNEVMSNNPKLQAFKDSLDQSLTMPTIEEMQNFWKPMLAAVKELWGLRGTSISEETVKAKFDEVTSTVLK